MDRPRRIPRRPLQQHQRGLQVLEPHPRHQLHTVRPGVPPRRRCQNCPLQRIQHHRHHAWNSARTNADAHSFAATLDPGSAAAPRRRRSPHPHVNKHCCRRPGPHRDPSADLTGGDARHNRHAFHHEPTTVHQFRTNGGSLRGSAGREPHRRVVGELPRRDDTIPSNAHWQPQPLTEGTEKDAEAKAIDAKLILHCRGPR